MTLLLPQPLLRPRLTNSEKRLKTMEPLPLGSRPGERNRGLQRRHTTKQSMQRTLETLPFEGQLEGPREYRGLISLTCWRKRSRLGGGVGSLEERSLSRPDDGRTQEITFGISSGNALPTRTRLQPQLCRMIFHIILSPNIPTRPSPVEVRRSAPQLLFQLSILQLLFQPNHFNINLLRGSMA